MSRKVKNKGKNSVGLIAHKNPKSSITEQYRMLRTNIEFASVDKKIKSIVVTSPTADNGKTTTASNLAIVLAQQEKKVLLVDADLRKPSLHYVFKTDNIYGLTSVLTHQNTLGKSISKTGILNLDILTSGPIPPNPSELLNSRSMESVIQEVNKTYDYIVFDTSPVLAVTDPQIIANKCDGIIMVIESKKTKKVEALKTKKMLEKVESSLLGVVLNSVDSKSEDYYYTYK